MVWKYVHSAFRPDLFQFPITLCVQGGQNKFAAQLGRKENGKLRERRQAGIDRVQQAVFEVARVEVAVASDTRKNPLSN